MKSILLVLVGAALFAGCGTFEEEQNAALENARTEYARLADGIHAELEVGGSLDSEITLNSSEAYIYGEGNVTVSNAGQLNFSKASDLLAKINSSAPDAALGNGLILIGQTTQADPTLNKSNVRLALMALGYEAKNIVCLQQAKVVRALAGCELYTGMAGLYEGLRTLDQSIRRTAWSSTVLDYNVRDLALTAQAFYDKVAPGFAVVPAALVNLAAAASAAQTHYNERPQTREAVLLASVHPFKKALFEAGTEDDMTLRLSKATSDDTVIGQANEDHLNATLTTIEQSVAASTLAKVGFDPITKASLADIGALYQAYNAVEGWVYSTGDQAILDAFESMRLSFVALEIQVVDRIAALDEEAKAFTRISSFMNTKHDTVKNSINNVR